MAGLSRDSCDGRGESGRIRGDGGLLALAAFGSQDRWMAGLPPEAFDAREMFLKGRHQVIYRRIATENTLCDRDSPHRVKIRLLRDCDLVNCIDVSVENPDGAHVFDLVKRIEVYFGGQRMDSISFREEYDVSCAAFGRRVMHSNGKTIFPLPMAPFHAHNLVMPASQHHDLVVYIEFADVHRVSPVGKVELYGKAYHLDTDDRSRLHGVTHEFTTVQTQAMECARVKRGRNVINVNFFNHPVYLQYFWGFDKSKVTNLTYEINGHPLYDGPLEPLEHHKLERRWDVDPVVMFFGDDPFDRTPRSSINFSRIDKAELIIDTSQEDEPMLYVGGFNIQGFRHCNGMIGLTFSK
jgi:hypothetical protein